MKRTFIIGDVHGCFEELLELLDKISFQKSDRLIFVGDVINKGPYSFEVLDFIKQNQFEVVLGNHEWKLIELFNKNKIQSSSHYQKLIDKFGSKKWNYINWIKSWPLFINMKNHIVIHAGKAPNISINNSSKKILTTIRTWDGKGINLNNPFDPPWYSLYKNKKTIVYGHWAAKGLTINSNSIGIDTGCVYGRQLTCYEIHSKKLYQVQAHHQYAEPVIE